MQFLAYIAIVQVILGATILFVSLLKYLGILGQFKEIVRAKTLFSSWVYLVSILLIIFFLIGYVSVAVWFILSEQIDAMQVLVGSVFFFGAIFVFLMVKVAKQMLISLVTESHLRKEKEQIEQVSAEKSEFLSRVSHEMRTPMNAIIGMSQIGITTEIGQKKDYCFEQIETSANYLLNVVNNVLEIQKIESGAFELIEQEFDLPRMIKRITGFAKQLSDNKNQQLIIDIDRNIPVYIILDEQRLSEVLRKLLNNAIKFTPERGTVSLIVSAQEKTSTHCNICFSVTDTGIGIAEEALEGLFTAYHQIDQSITRRYSGTGLGLAISKRIIELMGGKITVSSEPNKGSNFSFTIMAKTVGEDTLQSVDDLRTGLQGSARGAMRYPVHGGSSVGSQGGSRVGRTDMQADEWQANLQGDQAGTSDSSGVVAGSSALSGDDLAASNTDNTCIDGCFEGLRIIIVDDVDVNREIVRCLLEPTLVHIEEAVNGQEAIDLYSADPQSYDLILMDIQMPELDGLSATKAIRCLEHTCAKTIPILAMTANVFSEDINRYMAAGMDSYISKPLDMGDLITKMRNFTRIDQRMGV